MLSIIRTAVEIPKELETALVLTLVTSVAAPLLLLFVNRILNHQSNDVDMTKKALETTSQAVQDLAEAREELRQQNEQHEREIAVLNQEILKLKAAVTGKYRVTLEFMTGTNPSIISTNIVLVPEKTDAELVMTPLGEDGKEESSR